MLLVGNELEVLEQKRNAGKKPGKNQAVPKEAPPQKVKIEKSPSLKDTLKKIDSIGKEEDDGRNVVKDPKITYGEEQLKEALTQEAVIAQYRIFLDKVKKEQPRLYSSLKQQTPELNGERKVDLLFQNNSLLEEFKGRLKPSLISHFRHFFGVELEIAEQVADEGKIAKPKLFSDGDKFKKMSEKNPVLKKLKNLFSLDFD